MYSGSLDTLKAPFESILLRSMRWKPQLSKQRAFESAGWLPESFASTTRPPVLRYCEAPKLPSRQRIVAAMSNIVTSVQLAWCVIVLIVFWYCELKLTFSTRLFTSRHLHPRYILKLLHIMQLNYLILNKYNLCLVIQQTFNKLII